MSNAQTVSLWKTYNEDRYVSKWLREPPIENISSVS